MGQHWYDSCGKPQHTVIGKNGKERDTTLADARKLKLFPSVTGIISILEKQALIEYLHNQLLNAAVATPYHPHEFTEKAWRKAMLIQMRAHSKDAAERGTDIHKKLNDFFVTKHICTRDTSYLTPTIDLIEKTFGLDGWVSEQSFVNTKLGFAGCVDLYHPEKNIIIDFKTKDKEGLKGVKQYGEHKMQLAAYQLGLEMPSNTRRFNLFISTNATTPGYCALEKCKEFKRYVEMFSHLHSFWMLRNKYDPRIPVDVYL